MTDCDRVEEALGAYLDEELPEVERARVAAHLGGCLACSTRRDALRRLGEGIASSLPTGDAPPDLAEGVLVAARKHARDAGRPLRGPSVAARVLRWLRGILPTRGARVNAVFPCPSCGEPLTLGLNRCPACAGRVLVPRRGPTLNPWNLAAVLTAFLAGAAVVGVQYRRLVDDLARRARLALYLPTELEVNPTGTPRGVGGLLDAIDAGMRGTFEEAADVPAPLPGLLPLTQVEWRAVVDEVAHPAWASFLGVEPADAGRVEYFPPETDLVPPPSSAPSMRLRPSDLEPLLLHLRRPIAGNGGLEGTFRLGFAPHARVVLLARTARETIDPSSLRPTRGWFVELARLDPKPGDQRPGPGRYPGAFPGGPALRLTAGRDGEVVRQRILRIEDDILRFGMELVGTHLMIRLGDEVVGEVEIGIRNEATDQVAWGLALEGAEMAYLQARVGRLEQDPARELAGEVATRPRPPLPVRPVVPDLHIAPHPGEAPFDFDPLALDPGGAGFGPAPELPIPPAAAPEPPGLSELFPGLENEPGTGARWTRDGDALRVHGPDAARLWYHLPAGTEEVEVRVRTRSLVPPGERRVPAAHLVLFADREHAALHAPLPPFGRLGGVNAATHVGAGPLPGQVLLAGLLTYGLDRNSVVLLPAPVDPGDHELRVRVRRDLAAAWVNGARVAGAEGLPPGAPPRGALEVRYFRKPPPARRWVALQLRQAELLGFEVEVLDP